MTNTRHNIKGMDKSRNIGLSPQSITFFRMLIPKAVWGSQMFGSITIWGGGGQLLSYYQGMKTLNFNSNQRHIYAGNPTSGPLVQQTNCVAMYLIKP